MGPLGKAMPIMDTNMGPSGQARPTMGTFALGQAWPTMDTIGPSQHRTASRPTNTMDTMGPLGQARPNIDTMSIGTVALGQQKGRKNLP